jgi:hypothetical protein
MNEKHILNRALDKAQSGDIDGALALLNEAPNEDMNENVFGMIYFLLMAKDRKEDAIALATRCLTHPSEDLIQSKWFLRRGMLQLNLNQKDKAQADFAEVLKLRANEDHVRQVGQAMANFLDQSSSKKKDGP